MYGFGGLGEVEVEIWSDVTIAGQTTDKKERQSYSAIRQWKAEMSKMPGDNKNQFNSERECRHACGWTPGSHVPKEEKGNDYWFARTVKYWDDFRKRH